MSKRKTKVRKRRVLLFSFISVSIIVLMTFSIGKYWVERKHPKYNRVIDRRK